MQLFHTYHQNRFQQFIHSEFWLFDLSVWLHTFSRSMIAIFIPIFLLQTGYELGAIMLFYFFYYAFAAPTNFLARYLVRKIGAKKVIIIASLFSVAFFFSLYSLEAGSWKSLIPIALFAGVYDAFYWVAHLFFFMKCSTPDEEGGDHTSSDTSFLLIIKSVAGVTAPILGALVLVFFSQDVLIFFSIFILVLSIIPLLKMKKISDKPQKKQVSFKEFFKKGNLINDYLSKGFYHVHCITESVIWPLFIFMFFANIESVAILPIIVSVTSIILSFLIGRKKTNKKGKMIIVGALLISIVWVLRIFVESGIFYYVSVFLIGLFTVLIAIPLDSSIFKRGKKVDPLSTSMYRNIFAIVFGLFFYGTLSLLISVFNVSFIIATTGMFIVILISYFSGVKK